MRTAREMFDFAIKNRFGHDHLILRNGIQHFKIIESQLNRDDVVELTFLGKYKRENGEKLGLCAGAIAGSKIILGQKNYPHGERTKQLDLNKVENILKHIWYLYGEVVFQFQDISFSITMDSDEAKRTHVAILNYIDKLRKDSKQKSNFDGISDEIIKYKKLAEQGHITWGDFEAKKKKLLGI